MASTSGQAFKPIVDDWLAKWEVSKKKPTIEDAKKAIEELESMVESYLTKQKVGKEGVNRFRGFH